MSESQAQRLRCLLLASAAIATIAIGTVAQAADVAATTDAIAAAASDETDIVVTANRRTERLQSVAASVQALTSDQMLVMRIERPEDLAKAIPGLTISSPYGQGTAPIFVIRGITANDYSFSGQRPIALYTDDALRQSSVSEGAPFFDVERIEILKGPQGTLYGKNATGGAIRIINTAPGFDTTGYATVGYGNYNRREAKGAIQGTLVPDLLAARLAFTYAKDDGQVKNLTPGVNNEEQTDVFGARLSMQFQPDDRLTAVFRLTYNRSGDGGGSVFPGFINPVLTGGVTRGDLAFRQQRTNRASTFRLESGGSNLNVEYRLNDVYTLASVTALGWGKYVVSNDDDGLPIKLVEDDYAARNAFEAFQELRLASSYSGPFNFIVGGTYTHDRLDASNSIQLWHEPSLGIIDPFFFGSGGTGVTYANSFTQYRTGAAAFARGEFQITPSLKMFGGGRYSADKVRVADYASGFASNPGSGSPLADTILFSGLNRKSSFHNWSFEGGVEWKVTPDVLAYASFKQGYRAGAINAQAYFAPSEINTVAPETADSYEAGLKTEFFNRALTLNLAGFYVDYKDEQVQNVDGNTTLSTLESVNARIYGIEVETRVRASNNLHFNAGLSLLNPQYKKGSRLGVAFDANRLPIPGTGRDIGDNQMIGAARTSLTLGANFDIADVGAGTIAIHGDVVYTSSIFFSAYENPFEKQPSYALVNGRIGWDTSRFTIAIWAKNILDKRYFTYANDYRSNLGYVYYRRGAARTFGGELGFKF